MEGTLSLSGHSGSVGGFKLLLLQSSAGCSWESHSVSVSCSSSAQLGSVGWIRVPVRAVLQACSDTAPESLGYPEQGVSAWQHPRFAGKVGMCFGVKQEKDVTAASHGTLAWG